MTDCKQVQVPDIGNFNDVEVIEVMVKVGDRVQAEDALITIETDKATMDVPSPFTGVVKELIIKVGDKVSQGALILSMECDDVLPVPAAEIKPAVPLASTSASIPPILPSPPPKQAEAQVTVPAAPPSMQGGDGSTAHASPSIRRLARELGVDLHQLTGSGLKGRITKEDIQNFVKATLVKPQNNNGLQVAEMPVLDYAQFGAVETRPLSRIKKLSGAILHRNWVSIPHVTQHDEADITELEVFRKELCSEYAGRGIKITPMAFLLRAVVEALIQYPEFNAALDSNCENIILKKYFHIGVAVDTAEGLVVPVIRDVNHKGIVQLAQELGEISSKAREKKISAAEMQGGCFTISSLGGIGGTAFTPIINAPEVAILGVSRSCTKPVWKDGEFVPRLMLPLSLSYDHRVIDGAAGARFTGYLSRVLSDLRRLAL